MKSLEDKIISILNRSPADQYSIYRQLRHGNKTMAELVRSITILQNQRKIYVSGHRHGERTGIPIPIFSIVRVDGRRQGRRKPKLALDSLLAGITSERRIEYEFVAKSLTGRESPLQEKDIRNAVLDIGSGASALPQAMAEVTGEWDVIGVDVNPLKAFPSAATIRMDARSLAFRNNSFDFITCISTLEHIGLPAETYMVSHAGRDGDAAVMAEIKRVLKTRGLAIITVPYGPIKRPDHRVYDRKGLLKLSRGFEIVRAKFYRYTRGRWTKCSQMIADKKETTQYPLYLHNSACSCLLLKKKPK